MNTYSLLAKAYEATIDDVLYAMYLNLLKKHTHPSALLEAGCGTGYLSRELARMGYDVTGMDSNPSMLELASFYAGEENVTVDYKVHDLTEPFSGQFDVIIMPFDVVNHIEGQINVEKALTHITRALKPQSILIFDLLDQQFMDDLVGYEETIHFDGGELRWRVTRFSNQAIKHEIEVGEQSASHQEYYYSEAVVQEMLGSYDLLERLPLNGRAIYVMRKKEE